MFSTFVRVAFLLGAVAVLRPAEAAPEPQSEPQMVLQIASQAGLTALEFSGDGKTLATGGFDRTARLWNAQTGEVRFALPHSDDIRALALSPDGQGLATVVADSQMRLWDARTGQLKALWGNEGDNLWALDWSRDGKTIALAGASEIQVRDASNGHIRRRIRVADEENDWIESVILSPDARRVAAAVHRPETGGGGAVVWSARIWDTASGKLLKLVDFGASLDALAWSPDGQTLALLGQVAGLYDIEGKTAPRSLRVTGKCLAFAPDGQSLAVGRGEGVEIWDVASRKMARALPVRWGGVEAIAFSPDGQKLAAGCWPEVVMWETTGWTPQPVAKSNTEQVTALAWAPDGAVLAAGSNDGTLRGWNPQTGEPVWVLPGHRGIVAALSFSPDGKILASAANSNDPAENGEKWEDVLRLWDARTGTLRAELKGHLSSVWSLAWSPDGRILASGGWGDAIRLWEAASGREIAALDGRNVSVLAFSPAGDEIFALASEGVVRRWPRKNGQWQEEGERVWPAKKDENEVVSLAVARDGSFLVVGDSQRNLRLWNLKEKRWAKTLQTNNDGNDAEQLALAPDALALANGGEQGDVRLRQWKTPPLEKEDKPPFRVGKDDFLVLPAHDARVRCLAFSPDGQRLASGGEDGALKVWNRRGRLLATLRMLSWRPQNLDGAAWIATTPQGFYNASPAAAPWLRWRDQDQLLPAAAVAATWQKPEELRKSLALAGE